MLRVKRQALPALFLALVLTACITATPVPGATPTPLPTNPNRPSLVGMWVGVYTDGAQAIFNFQANGNISIAVYGGLQGGTYTVNYDTKPFQLDFVFETPQETINTIFEFVDAETVRIANVVPGEPRPTGFSDYIDLKPYVYSPPSTSLTPTIAP